MGGYRIDTEHLIPVWLKALAVIDEESPTTTQLRAWLDVGSNIVQTLKSRELVQGVPGLSAQNKPCETLVLTDKGKRQLADCLREYQRFISGEDIFEDDEDDDEGAMVIPMPAVNSPTRDWPEDHEIEHAARAICRLSPEECTADAISARVGHRISPTRVVVRLQKLGWTKDALTGAWNKEKTA